MTKYNNKKRLILHQRVGANKPNNKQATASLQLKSKCGDCFHSEIHGSNDRVKATETLSPVEKIKILREEIYEFSIVPVIMIENHIRHLKKRLAIEEKKHAQSVKEHSAARTIPAPEKPKEAVVKTIIKGKKSDFAKNSANYYFNEKNISGLHLSHLQLDHITDMLCDNFIAEDGTPLSWRSVHDILKTGFKMDENGELIA